MGGRLCSSDRNRYGVGRIFPGYQVTLFSGSNFGGGFGILGKVETGAFWAAGFSNCLGRFDSSWTLSNYDGGT